MLTLELGIPEGGVVKDRRATKLGPGRAVTLANTYERDGALATRPGLTAFGATPDTKPVLNLFTSELADGTRVLVRLDEDKFYSWDGSAWVERMAGATVFTGTATQPFGIAMCNNELVFAQGVGADKAWRWTGAGDIVQIANSGVFTNVSFKHLVFFSSRVIGAYTTATNGAVEVLGSEPGSNTAWALANGAIQGFVHENPSRITGLSSNDAELVIWKEYAVVLGSETGDFRLPIQLRQLRADGIGSVAQRCAASFGGIWFNLSHEGFYALAGDSPQFIDIDIRRDFWSRVNRTKLSQIHSLVIKERGLIVWFVPEGTDTYPHAAWVYNTRTGGWDRWEFGSLAITASARTAVSDSTFKVVDLYNSSPNDVVDTGIHSGAIVDSFVGTSDTPRYILGDSTGKTYTLDEFAQDDAGTAFQWVWETDDFRWAGTRDDATGQTAGVHDLVTFSEAMIEYHYAGPGTSLQIEVSTDSGETWTILTVDGASSFTLTPTTGGFAILRAFGRATGYWVRLRFTFAAVRGFPEFFDLRVFGHIGGEVR